MRAGIIFNVTRDDRRCLKPIVADQRAAKAWQHVLARQYHLATADGCDTAEIKRRSGKSKPSFIGHRAGFIAEGMAGLCGTGTVIPAALITGIRSDLPGQVTAQVTEHVYDSPTGKYLLIPQGSRLIGVYDSQISFGQNRVLLVWKRIILPNGQSIVLERQPGADTQGSPVSRTRSTTIGAACSRRRRSRRCSASARNSARPTTTARSSRH